jgi:PAS domain S-box-containing protein
MSKSTVASERRTVQRRRARRRKMDAHSIQILESMSDAFMALDREWRYTYVNGAAERRVRLRREEMLGRTIWDVFPQQSAQVESELRRAMEEGVTVRFEIYLAPVDTWFEVTVYPSADGITLYSRDITKRKRAEEKLRQSESQLAEAQRLAHVGSWNWDLQSNVSTWTDELYRIYGVHPQAFNPGDVDVLREFIHVEDRALVRGAVESSLKTGEPFSFFYRIHRADGEERVIHARGDVASDEHGNLIRMFGTAQDVTERKQAEERLRATTKHLRALSARLQSAREEEGTRIAREIHDELGAALSSLRWDLEEVEEVIAESGDQSQLAALRKKLEAMMRLTDTTVNTVRRIASELRPTALDTLGLVEAIQSQAEQFQERTGIIVNCDCSLENMDFNPEQSTAIFRIYQEALTNILRHAQATRVDISMEEEEGGFILRISDNGRGITEDEKTSQHTLGLLGMRERAYFIGGTVEVESRSGGGATVMVRIPAPA